MDEITSFKGEHEFLSNFSPARVQIGPHIFPTLENAFQAAKTLDERQREAFTTMTPGQAKKAGRKVDLRPYWDETRLTIMKGLLRIKFSDETLAAKLLATGDAKLVEGNTWNDTFWGVCRGKGKNWLGTLLMEVRDELQGVTTL